MKHHLVVAIAMALAVPAAAEEQCPPLKLWASVDLIPYADGRVEFVPVEIAGVPKKLVLDLGAEVTMISQRAADELHLKTHQSGLQMYGLSGAMTDRVTTADIKIGHMKGNLKVMVGSFLDNMYGDPDVIGVLGADVLSNYDVAIDFGASKLDLLDHDHCAGKVIYWPATNLAVVPFRRLAIGQIVFDVTLDGRTLKAILDTGASNSTLRLDVAERLYDIKAGAADTPELGGLNERADLKTYKHTFKTLDFTGIAVGTPTFDLIPDMLTRKLAPGVPTGSHLPEHDDTLEAPVLIGMNVLKHLHIFIAYKEQKLYITAAGAPK